MTPPESEIEYDFSKLGHELGKLQTLLAILNDCKKLTRRQIKDRVFETNENIKLIYQVQKYLFKHGQDKTIEWIKEPTYNTRHPEKDNQDG